MADQLPLSPLMYGNSAKATEIFCKLHSAQIYINEVRRDKFTCSAVKCSLKANLLVVWYHCQLGGIQLHDLVK
jgi:hypothetical protein